VVFVDEACDGLSVFDPGCGQGTDVRVVVGRELASPLVRSVAVEVACVVVEDLLGVATVEKQDTVGALFPC
jgi:hypothetical protein